VGAFGLHGAGLTAQVPTCLTTFFSGSTSTSQGCAALFDITVINPITIQSIACNFTASSGTPVGLDVWITPNTWVGNETNQAAWTLVGSDNGGVTSAGGSQPTTFVFASPILLTPGTYGMSLVSKGATSHRYSSATANTTVADSNISLDLGAIHGTPFTSGLLQPRHWNGTICYLVGTNVATATQYGSGCGGGDPSTVYEGFSNSNPFDLANTGFMFPWLGASYGVIPGAPPLVMPSGAPLAFSDDQTQAIPLPWTIPSLAGPTNMIWVCSNGWISFEATTSTDYTETVPELLAGETRICPLWDDLNPSASTGAGAIHAEQDPSDPSAFHVTWLGVPEYQNTGANDFQVTIRQSGFLEVKYGTMTVADCMVALTRGHGAVDPGSTDLSTIQGFPLGDDRPDLGLRASTRPIVGTTGVSETFAIPGTALAGVVFYGFQKPVPPIDLGFLGAPGCSLQTSVEATLLFTPTGTTASHSVPVPNDPRIAGVHVYHQSAVVAPGLNPFNVITSNGLDWKIDVQ
jgi:hypothetical protein